MLKHKWLTTTLAILPITIGLAGCGQSQAVTPTGNNVMGLVQVNEDSISQQGATNTKSKDRAKTTNTGDTTQQQLNQNTNNMKLVEANDGSQLAYWPSGFSRVAGEKAPDYATDSGTKDNASTSTKSQFKKVNQKKTATSKVKATKTDDKKASDKNTKSDAKK